MNTLREIAYQIDPVLWVSEVLDVEPTPWQQRVPARPTRGLDYCLDGAAGRQDHDRGMGDRALHAVYAR